jgi:esterase/lipase
MPIFVIVTLMIETHTRFRAEENLVKSNKVVFIFTAFGTKMGIYRPFIKALNKRGYSCIIYDYPASIVHDAQLSEWHKFYDNVLADVKARIQRLRESDYTHFYAHGSSMGTLLASLVSRKCPEVTHTVLNLPYGDLAYSIYTVQPARIAKEKFVKQGINQEAFADAFAYIDPLKTAPAFKNKKVLLYISKTDKILDYKDTRRTQEALEQAGAHLTYFENKRLGHHLGGAKNILGIKRLVTFLES